MVRLINDPSKVPSFNLIPLDIDINEKRLNDYLFYSKDYFLICDLIYLTNILSKNVLNKLIVS